MSIADKNHLPVIAIVGRPNVGKSTLFNRLIGKRRSIETKEAGTTRDRLYGEVSWVGKRFKLIDTAGLIKATDEIEEEAAKSIEIAIEEASTILFLCDVKDGVDAQDREIAKKLRKSKKKIVLAVNKCDKKYDKDIEKDFRRLGFDRPFMISAIQGRNTGDLLDEMCENIESDSKDNIVDDSSIKLSIIGRPNAGKSTLLNSMIGSKKMIVSSKPGTTRDSADFTMNYKGQLIRVVDTAGIRRRSKVKRDTPESFALLRAMSALSESKIALYVIDAVEGITSLDLRLLGEAKEMGKSIVLVINKIDKIEEDRETFMAKVLGELRVDLNFIPWIPVVFISAKDKVHITELLNQVLEVHKERNREIKQSQLKEVFVDAINSNPQTRYFKTLRFERANPPVFKLKTLKNKKPHFSHMRFLENKIRDNFPYFGTPIFIDWDKETKNSKRKT